MIHQKETKGEKLAFYHKNIITETINDGKSNQISDI